MQTNAFKVPGRCILKEIEIKRALLVQILCVALDTDPVVSAHGVEAVGTTDEYQVIVSGNQHFDEVVALVLKTEKNTETRFEKQPASCS